MSQGRNKRPPISVDELDRRMKPRREEPEQGDLSYIPKGKLRRQVEEPEYEEEEEQEVVRAPTPRAPRKPSVVWDKPKEQVKKQRQVTHSKRRFNQNSIRSMLPVLVSVLLAAVMLFWFAPNKSEFSLVAGEIEGIREGQVTLSGRLDSLSASIDAEITRMDLVVANTQNYVEKSELSGYASKTEIPAVESITVGMETLDERIFILERRLALLEE